MAKIEIDSADDFTKFEGQLLGCSNWLTITQKIIDDFADATLDHQWIHTDPMRASKDSPFGSTIAHGYLIISLLPHFLGQILQVNNLTQLINYSIDKMVFKSPVLVNQKLRLKVAMDGIKDLGQLCKVRLASTFEVEGQSSPAAEGTIVFLYYFK